VRLSVVAGTIAALAVGVRSVTVAPGELAAFSREPPIATMALAGWWGDGWRDLPAARDDLRRNADHPFTVQYAGALDALSSPLADKGWETVDTAEPRDALKFLSTALPLRQLPVLPQVHEGRHEALVMAKADGEDRRWVLRLWPAWRSLEPGALPLWIGNVSRQEKRELMGMVAYPVTTDGFGPALEQLGRDLGWARVRTPDPPSPLLLIQAP